jgi:hypothetical protein
MPTEVDAVFAKIQEYLDPAYSEEIQLEVGHWGSLVVLLLRKLDGAC